jgi:hypothetical protein
MLTSDPLAGIFAGLYIDGRSMSAHCSPCRKRVEIDPLKMPLRSQYVGRKFRCSGCDQIGQGILGAPYTNISEAHYDRIERERNERGRQVEGILRARS